jgi:hypothetical protein
MRKISTRGGRISALVRIQTCLLASGKSAMEVRELAAHGRDTQRSRRHFSGDERAACQGDAVHVSRVLAEDAAQL